MRIIGFILVLSVNQAVAQLYLSRTKSWDRYVEIFKDSARVEIFKTHCHHWCVTRYVHNEVLLLRRSGDTLFAGKQTYILKQKGAVVISYKHPYRNKYSKAEVYVTKLDSRDTLRKFAYMNFRDNQLRRLRDSLDGPVYQILYSPTFRFSKINPNLFSFAQFAKLYGQEIDSLSAGIIRQKDPKIDLFYQKIDSLKSLDTVAVFKLLATTNYQLYCGQYLLRRLAKDRPELLVTYVDKNYTNKKTVLHTIRDHEHFKEITRNVESCGSKTYGKKQIVHQRAARISGDVAAGAFYIGIVLAEISLIVLLVVVISR